MIDSNHFIGYSWLANRFSLELVHFQESTVTRRLFQSNTPDGRVLAEYTPQYYPGDHPIDHIVFALKHEGLNLALLKRVFEIMDAEHFVDFINQTPSGKYARQVGFLYETLTGKLLDGVGTLSGNYIPVVDPDLYVTPEGIPAPRWRVYNNLPGDNRFCPLIRKTDVIRRYMDINLADEIKSGYSDVDPRLFKRAVNYLYFKETKSSNEIEHERPGTKRIEQFVDLLRHAGSIPLSERLTESGLAACQKVITDPRFARDTFRGDQNYVAESSRYGAAPIIHFIGTPPECLDSIMSGLNYCEQKTRGVNAVVRATSIAFSFVFIHPFDDGNGRVHRFLINDILSSDGILDRGVVLPISAVILRGEPRYTEILEAFSRPLMRAVNYDLHQDQRITVTNPEEVDGLYRFPDLTIQAEYLFSVIDETIKVDLIQEIKLIQKFDAFRIKLKQIVDMPNYESELLMKLIHENNGSLSNNKRKSHFDMLSNQEISDIEHAYRFTFAETSQNKDENDGDPGGYVRPAGP